MDLAHLGDDAEHRAGDDRKAVGLENLRADMRVQAEQADGRRVDGARDRLQAGEVPVAPGWIGEPELLVLVRGGDRLVGGGVHPGVSRSITGALTRSSVAMRITRSSSSSESITMRPTPMCSARVISAADLLLPCSESLAPGTPAAAATASSPPEQVSRRSPCSITVRATEVHKNALPA